MKNFGFALDSTLRATGMRAAALAERSGISDSILSRIISGKINPSEDKLPRILAAFDAKEQKLLARAFLEDQLEVLGLPPGSVTFGESVRSEAEAFFKSVPASVREDVLDLCQIGREVPEVLVALSATAEAARALKDASHGKPQ
jgi:transcriptional regulator with XRE-family HTH domain